MNITDSLLQEVMAAKAKGMANEIKIDNTINAIKKVSERMPEIVTPLSKLIKDTLNEFGFKDMKADTIADLLNLGINDFVLKKMLTIILDPI